MPSSKSTTKVKRCIFPVDHDVVKQDLKKEMEELLIRKTVKWNFDFGNNLPITGGDFDWIECDSEIYGEINTQFCSLVYSEKIGKWDNKNKKINKRRNTRERKKIQSILTGKKCFEK